MNKKMVIVAFIVAIIANITIIPKTIAKDSLSLPTRKIIFYKIAQAEDQAMKDADRKISPSNVMKNIELNRALEDKYKKQIREKYKISKETQQKIVLEGVTSKWKLP